MYNDYLFWKQGFNKRPDRVKNVKALKDRTDLVKGADGENLVLYRGVSDDRWNDQFKAMEHMLLQEIFMEQRQVYQRVQKMLLK